jgi:hypothetical protein
MAIFMGVFPNVFLRPMEPAVQRIVQRVQAHQPATAGLGAPVAPAALAAPARVAPLAPVAPVAPGVGGAN